MSVYANNEIHEDDVKSWCVESRIDRWTKYVKQWSDKVREVIFFG